MKKKIVLTMTIALFFMLPFIGMAQGTLPSNPPGPGGGAGHGSNGDQPGGGAPIDGGITMLLVLGASVAGRKVYQYNKK